MTSVVQSEEILVQQSEQLFIGVDGGGSKTLACLTNTVNSQQWQQQKRYGQAAVAQYGAYIGHYQPYEY